MGHLPGTGGSVEGCCLAEGAGVEVHAAGEGTAAYRGEDRDGRKGEGGMMGWERLAGAGGMLYIRGALGNIDTFNISLYNHDKLHCAIV